MGARTIALVLCLTPAALRAQDATTPAAPTAPHPTLENISIVWPITGDDDLDGVVGLRYRAVGEAGFHVGLPLRRVPAGTAEGFSWINMHAGSVFDLQPGTTYEIELSLDDPDGGSTTQTLMVTTRPEPTVPADARMVPVTPASFDGAASSAVPGDVLVLADGSYPGFTFDRDGELDRPIVLRAEHPGMAVIEDEIRLDDRSNVWLEDLTMHNRIVIHDTHGIVIRRCAITTPESGVVGQLNGATDAYVCDNVVLGPTMRWDDTVLGADGDNLGEGIQMSGPGNVICHNYVHGFRDAISTMEDSEAVDQYSLDILENDIELAADDAVEADFSMGNVRVMRNRITNCFMGISGQPSLGGPSYYVRNVMFNIILSAFKLHRGSVGDVAFHNTVVKCGDGNGIYAGVTWSRALFRNNLFLGGEGGGTYGGYDNGTGRVLSLEDADGSCDFDYDGLGSIGTGTFTGRIGATRFNSLAELQSTTTEAHAVQIADMSIFAASVQFPSTGPYPERDAPDLRLADGSTPVDRGIPLPNIDDGFVGAAPDLGAYEAGSLLPHYGPRSAGTEPVCGNRSREGAEQCDDGNTQSGDGCSATCTLEAVPGEDGGGVIGPDGGIHRDGGPPGAMAGGCCSVIGARGTSWGAIALAIAMATALWRRRRVHR